jgi:DNA-binding NarL/FixJ family response regulator
VTSRTTLLRGSPLDQRIHISHLERLRFCGFVAMGMRNKEIAASLDVSEDTVKLHVKSILGKLKVHDRTAAVRLALQRGIIHLD